MPPGITTTASRLSPILAALAFLAAPAAVAQPGYYESEPNNTPQEANPVSGEVVLYGTMVSNDQDGFLWTVTDEGARKRWNFELHGIPGALTVTNVARVEYTEDGLGVTSVERLMKMGTRDGITPSIHRNQLFDPGEYLIGIAYAGGPKKPVTGGGLLELKPIDVDFGDEGVPQAGDASMPTEAQAEEPGSYRLIISEGAALNVSRNPGPREARSDAQAVRLGRGFATFEPLETAWYSFTFDENAATQRWDIEVRAPIGRHLDATLHDAEGNELLSRRADSHGLALMEDLAPEATTWFLELTTNEPGFVHWVGIETAGVRVDGEEAEPNGERPLANRVDFTQPVTGRIGGSDTWDYFRFEVDEARSEQLQTLRVDSQPETKLNLCLHLADWTLAQCRNATTPVELPDLLLSPGHWGISLSRASEVEYVLSLLPQGPIETGMEAEPNDTVETAAGVPSNLRIKGRFTGNDTDFYRFLIADEPQLWRFQVIGDEIREIGYYDGSGNQKTKLSPAPGQRRVLLDNVYLLPGTHYLRVTGNDGGEYAVLARALGPPDPNGELEPNDASNMQRLAIGQTRRGLLTEEDDSDYYRFFLANWDHVRLTVKPPPDGIVDPHLYWYGAALGDGQPGGPGEPLYMEGLFPPGDYHVVLSPTQVSDAEYTLSLQRLPRFSCPSDCEPNGMREIYLAAPLPPDLVVEGNTGEWRDWDYYQLPAFDQPTEIVLRSAESVREVTLGTHYKARERLQFDADLGGYRATVPAGGPYRLMLDSRGTPYRLQLEFPNGPITAVTEPLPANVKLVLDTGEVSAFRLHGQRVSGRLELTNTGSEPIEAALEVVTSDHRWTVNLAESRASLPVGGSASLPIEVLVPADAWADRPARISARARDASGRQAETWAEISVGSEVLPVAPYLHWPIPEALRGGFNAAWLPFGGEWTDDTPKSLRNETPRDGLVFPGTRVGCCADNDGWSEEEKPRLSVDLPGDLPLPVAGVAINHFGTPRAYQDIRRATLLVSLDGTNFEEALTFETLPVETEQYFALEKPAPARFAQLRIDATFQEQSAQTLSVAEWKVILEPGYDLSGGHGFNLADPALGGHVVWAWPPEGYLPTSILSEPDQAQRAGLRRGEAKDYVIAFNQNRAAQIGRIEWIYPDDLSDDRKNFERVDISVSLESPVGPWLPLGKLDMAGAKTTGIVELAEPAWARFVRFTAHLRPDASLSYEPGVLRIWEHPTDSEYRSALTEWGDISPRAYYELQAGLDPEPAINASGNVSREAAATLEVDALARGQVSLGKLEQWYRLSVPAGQNTLAIELTGDPTVRTVIKMEDSAGNTMPLRRNDQRKEPARHLFEAIVEAGSEVWINVAEPPRNVIFSWDTSASVGAWLDLINRSLVAFSGQVVPGQEAVNLMPFPLSPLLEEWYGEPYILQTILNDYRRPASSSSAEYTLKKAAKALAPLPGTKAIVVITDAQTPHDGEMWEPMQEVRPRIFGIGVAGAYMDDHHRFRDWASINGGHFTQLRYDGEMEVAFDRATTLMHRPAGYTLLVESEFREAPGPGTLAVVAGEDTSGAGGAAVELILDASGSMLQRMEGKRRIVVAKEVLSEAVREHIPAGTPVALRVFGHKEVDSCRTDLEIPLAPLDPEAAAAKIAGIQAMNLARTPIADSLAAVESDLKGAANAAVVLVTDGEETCEGDPGKVIEALQAKGFSVNLNIVGFAIDDADLAAQFESWAALGGGRYFAANDQGGLSAALEEALRVPFTVYDQGGNEVAAGQVGAEPVELERGVYRVVVNTAPPRTFEEVEVHGEDEITLELE